MRVQVSATQEGIADLELAFRDGLVALCKRERLTEIQVLEAAILMFPTLNAVEALRSYLMRYFRAAATNAGHSAIGHGLG